MRYTMTFKNYTKNSCTKITKKAFWSDLVSGGEEPRVIDESFFD